MICVNYELYSTVYHCVICCIMSTVRIFITSTTTIDSISRTVSSLPQFNSLISVYIYRYMLYLNYILRVLLSQSQYSVTSVFLLTRFSFPPRKCDLKKLSDGFFCAVSVAFSRKNAMCMSGLNVAGLFMHDAIALSILLFVFWQCPSSLVRKAGCTRRNFFLLKGHSNISVLF